MKVAGIVLIVCGLITARVHAQSTDLQKADSIASLYPGHSLSDLGLFSYELTGSLPNEKSKFRAIYKWVCSNIEGDYEMMVNHKRRQAKVVIQILIDRHKTVCTGYAWLVRELAIRAGISCEIVHGYGRSARSNIGGNGVVNHSWNAVMLDGEWFLCDPTWSSGTVNSENIFTWAYDDAYFLSDPEWFIFNHYPVDRKWSLLEKTPDLHAFLTAPLIYMNAYKYRVMPVEPSTFRVEVKKDTPVSFTFMENGTLRRESKSYSTKGIRVFHVTVDKNVVISYQVTVRP